MLDPTSRPPVDIVRLTQFLDSLQSYSEELVQNLPPGAKLCHYTSLEGARSILVGGDLWLTHARFSNDSRELTHGYELVHEVIKELRSGAGTGEQAFLDQLDRSIEGVLPVYVCCFCEETSDELLSQWRGYADNGGGIRFEFDPQGFTSVAGGDSPPRGLIRLWKVFYDRTQQGRIVRQCIQHPWGASNEEERLRFVTDALNFFVPTFKDEAFREEKERRLIFTPDPSSDHRPSFRTARGLLAPYFSLRELTKGGPPFRLPVRSLTIGPSANKDLNVESARMMVARYGYDAQVLASKIPFRS